MYGFPAGKRFGVSHRKLAGSGRIWENAEMHQVRHLLYILPRGVHYRDADGYFAADLDYCKGCGICAHECWPGAIKMVNEEE